MDDTILHSSSPLLEFNDNDKENIWASEKIDRSIDRRRAFLLHNRLFKVEKTLSFFPTSMCWESLSDLHSLTWIAHRHLNAQRPTTTLLVQYTVHISSSSSFSNFKYELVMDMFEYKRSSMSDCSCNAKVVRWSWMCVRENVREVPFNTSEQSMGISDEWRKCDVNNTVSFLLVDQGSVNI